MSIGLICLAAGCGLGAPEEDAGSLSAQRDAGPGLNFQPSDAGMTASDAGAMDSGAPLDAGPVDAGGLPDAGSSADGGPADAGLSPDAGGLDAGAVDAGPTDAGLPSDAGFTVRGQFTVLTYNVAGLPQGLSSSNPTANIPQISPRLNAFPLVLVQEDFAFHAQLIQSATHLYKSPPMAAVGTDLGDGLNFLSRFPMTGLLRTRWIACNGIIDAKNDCLTSKGFAFAVLELAPGFVVHVYDLHADAGRGSGDAMARQTQMNQLVAAINARSQGQALIVAGDTNMNQSDEAQLQTLLMGAGLTDGCRAVGCADRFNYDRIMFRSGSTVRLQPQQLVKHLTFVDDAGVQLSDHEPISVDFTWGSP